MSREVPKPREDLLHLIVTDADGKRLWAHDVKAIPRIGEDVLIFGKDGEGTLYGATVTDVLWGFYEHVAGQVVTVKLGPSLVKPPQRSSED